MIKHFNKIVIIGGPGTGKTTLAKNLASLLSITSYSLDDIKFNNNWKPKDTKEVDFQINNLLKKEQWIIEGNHLRNLELILEECDFVIFLDFPMELQVKGIFKRFFSNFHHCIKDMKNCKEKISFSFFLKTIFFNIKKRPKIISLLMKGYNFRLMLIANYKQINDFLLKVKNQV